VPLRKLKKDPSPATARRVQELLETYNAAPTRQVCGRRGRLEQWLACHNHCAMVDAVMKLSTRSMQYLVIPVFWCYAVGLSYGNEDDGMRRIMENHDHYALCCYLLCDNHSVACTSTIRLLSLSFAGNCHTAGVWHTRCLSSGQNHLLCQLSGIGIGHRPTEVLHDIQYNPDTGECRSLPNIPIPVSFELYLSIRRLLYF